MNFEHIDVRLNDPVATITLDRRAKLNAITPTMLSELIEAAQRISESNVRSVVLSGAGTSFSAGMDIGIPLAWGGIGRLVRQIGPARTKELVLTCRPFLAEEAQLMGFAVTTTKRHVAEILQGDLSRDDAIGLIAALDDPAWSRHRDAYMEQFTVEP